MKGNMINRKYSKAEERWANLNSAEQEGWFKSPRTRKEIAILMNGADTTSSIASVCLYVKKGFLIEKSIGNHRAYYSLGKKPSTSHSVEAMLTPEARAKAKATREANRKTEQKVQPTQPTQPVQQVKIEVNGVAITAGVEDTIKIIKALK